MTSACWRMRATRRGKASARLIVLLRAAAPEQMAHAALVERREDLRYSAQPSAETVRLGCRRTSVSCANVDAARSMTASNGDREDQADRVMSFQASRSLSGVGSSIVTRFRRPPAFRVRRGARGASASSARRRRFILDREMPVARSTSAMPGARSHARRSRPRCGAIVP